MKVFKNLIQGKNLITKKGFLIITMTSCKTSNVLTFCIMILNFFIKYDNIQLINLIIKFIIEILTSLMLEMGWCVFAASLSYIQ